MKFPLIRHRAGKIAAFVLAAAGWLSGGYWFRGAGKLFQEVGWEQRIWWHLLGFASFFLLAMFLPEERKVRSLSLGRQGALRTTSFAGWLVAVELVMHFKGLQRAPEALALLLGTPLLTYFGCLYMIRGFRAVPEYGVEPELPVKGGEAEAAGAAPVVLEKEDAEVEKKDQEKEDPASPVSEDARVEDLLEKFKDSAVGRS